MLRAGSASTVNQANVQNIRSASSSVYFLNQTIAVLEYALQYKYRLFEKLQQPTVYGCGVDPGKHR